MLMYGIHDSFDVAHHHKKKNSFIMYYMYVQYVNENILLTAITISNVNVKNFEYGQMQKIDFMIYSRASRAIARPVFFKCSLCDT